ANALHDLIKARLQAGVRNLGRRLVAQPTGCKWLHDLNAAAMPMHIAEAAQVHADIKAELLPRGKCAWQLVMLAAMAQSKIDDLAALRVAERLHACLDLPITIKASLVEERGRQLHVKRLPLIEQIDSRRGFNRSALHQLSGCLGQFRARLGF